MAAIGIKGKLWISNKENKENYRDLGLWNDFDVCFHHIQRDQAKYSKNNLPNDG
jgi:hypothetical protein